VHVAGTRDKRCIQGFGGETRGKEDKLRRPRSRWEDNIKIDPQKWHGGVDWINLAQNRTG
jgi:hypothetical protein